MKSAFFVGASALFFLTKSLAMSVIETAKGVHSFWNSVPHGELLW
jgi:hypothetical protein